MTSIRYVGMDVHKDSINIAVLDEGKNALTFEKQLARRRTFQHLRRGSAGSEIRMENNLDREKRLEGMGVHFGRMLPASDQYNGHSSR